MSFIYIFSAWSDGIKMHFAHEMMFRMVKPPPAFNSKRFEHVEWRQLNEYNLFVCKIEIFLSPSYFLRFYFLRLDAFFAYVECVHVKRGKVREKIYKELSAKHVNLLMKNKNSKRNE